MRVLLTTNGINESLPPAAMKVEKSPRLFHHGSTGAGTDPSLFTQTYTSENIAQFFASSTVGKGPAPTGL